MRVLDAVGLVATPTLQLNVRPKIPVAHLLYILRAANVVPQFATGQGLMARSDDLTVLIAHWFTTALERVLQEGLARDYLEHRDELTAVRGRLLTLDTARLFYRGRLAVVADYEEYDFDTPLNRTLLHVARIVAGATILPETIRRRALSASKRFDGVGWLRHSDHGAQIDRRTQCYGDALSLARQILAATGRTLEAGGHRSWTFLFRTPTPVEAGIRALVARALAPGVLVRKGPLPLQDAGLTINPDLVFSESGVSAIGDVKYKLVGTEWDRGDLYEVVAFAAGYRAKRGVVALFGDSSAKALPAVAFGEHRIEQVTWPTDAGLEPYAASNAFADRVRAWYLGGPTQTAESVAGDPIA